MIYSVLIPLALLVAPWVLARYVFVTDKTRALLYLPQAGYLLAASILWVLALVLPNIPVSPQTDTFTMHSLGGAVAAVLFAYFVKVYQVRFSAWWQPLLAIYFFASGLGVLNELFEFFLTVTGIAPVVGGDEWWDLLANTIGAFMTFSLLQIAARLKKR